MALLFMFYIQILLCSCLLVKLPEHRITGFLDLPESWSSVQKWKVKIHTVTEFSFFWEQNLNFLPDEGGLESQRKKFPVRRLSLCCIRYGGNARNIRYGIVYDWVSICTNLCIFLSLYASAHRICKHTNKKVRSICGRIWNFPSFWCMCRIINLPAARLRSFAHKSYTQTHSRLSFAYFNLVLCDRSRILVYNLRNSSYQYFSRDEIFSKRPELMHGRSKDKENHSITDWPMVR
jgi:hypothetical protein